MSYLYYIGIDVSKDHFDAALHMAPEKPKRFANTQAGFAAFAQAFQGILDHSLVVLEATGGYETALMNNIYKARSALHRVQPLKSAHYIRSLRGHIKTDALDAVALARYGFERHETLALFTPADETLQELEVLHTRLCDLKAMRKAEKQRARHPRYATLKESLNAVCHVLDTQIEAMAKRMNHLVEQAHHLKQKYDIMIKFSGIGSTTAMTLLACMPEIGTINRKQIASLAGLAPHPQDSGKTQGYRATRGGRATVRSALFMAALSAKAYNPQLKTFYDNLIARGKKPMVALTAVMRKMIVILNAKIRDNAYT